MAKRFRNAFLTGLLFPPSWNHDLCSRFSSRYVQGASLPHGQTVGTGIRTVLFGLETLLAVVGLLVGILALTVLGFLSNYVLGKFFISTTEKVLDKVPFLSTVYRSVKQIVETFGKDNRAVFREVVLVEYPRKDCWVLGFVTAKDRVRRNLKLKKKLPMFSSPPPQTQPVVSFCLFPKRM